MADERKEIPLWQVTQNAQIERATSLIKLHGSNVEFVVSKDRSFLNEAITPLTNIDGAIDYIYRQEGRGINTTDVANFRKDYADLISLISKVELTAVNLLAKAGVRVDNRNLDRKIREARKTPQAKKEDKKEDKKAS